jgi:ribosomal protein S18 acetylase RimI-like enzyme
MGGPEIVVRDEDRGLAAELGDAIYAFNVEATGIDDGRLLRAEVRDQNGGLVAGLTGWTWGGTGFVDVLWVREDRRGLGLGTAILDAAEAEARSRRCRQMVLRTHSFQAPGLYRTRGYLEVGRVEDYPMGHSELLLVKRLGSGP